MNETETYMKHKKALAADDYASVIKTFCNKNAENNEDHLMLTKLLQSKEILYDICRVVRIMNSFGDKETNYNNFFEDLTKFVDTSQMYFKNPSLFDKKLEK